MKYEYIYGDSFNPYRNLAFEQALFKYAGSGKVIIYLWQNDNTIVIGRNQDAYGECLTDEFRQQGGIIARRRSGGGAVFHDLGNLNYSVISIANEAEKCRYQEIVKFALSLSFNVNAEYNGRNDILVNGRKFSGNAVFKDERICCQHGTILINTDIAKMQHFLTPDVGKLARNHVSSVESRVINLSDVSGDITVETMKSAVIEAVRAEKLEISNVDFEQEISDLTKMYASDNWVYGGKQG